MATQSVRGATFSFSEAGAGTPLVFVHGFPLDSRMWEHQVRALSSRGRVITLDLRGFGRSPSVDPFTIESLADDVHALLEQIHAVPCVLCGLSMGGYVALAFARRHPSDLKALILVDTRAEGDSAEGKAGRQKMIDLVRASGSKAVADQMLPKMLAPTTPQSRPQVVRQVREMMESTPPLTIEHALEALRDREDYTSDLASIAVPTLILVGEHDAITPPDMSRALQRSIPRSKLAIIPDAGHMSPLEQADAVNREIGAFLGSSGI